VLFDVVDGADVRMVQRGGGARLPSEPIERLRVGGEFFRQEIERDKASEPVSSAF
jgi:hypothetical protein